jgi:hypothetical protein
MTMHRGKSTISRIISGAKPTMYIHESQMDTDDKAPGAKTPFQE